MDSLTPAKKAQLHEVADLMFEIYRTLVRMRYLDASWICEGPHEIDEALLAIYRAHGLDDSVIYLYSILPYVDAAGAVGLDFLQGGEFADFRKEGDVKQGRDPFYEENENELLPPHMTTLSLLGNHRSVIFYNSREHWIAIIDQECDGSTDHNLHEGRIIPNDEFGSWHEEGEGEQDPDGVDEDELEGDGDGEEGEEDEEEDEDDGSDGEGNHWDEMSGRPAGRVLRDIIRWYYELVETPGGGEQSAQSRQAWEPELLKPLYRKHGWPGSHFDGDAFLVDLDCTYAVRTAESRFTMDIKVLQAHLKDFGPDGQDFAKMKEREAAAETVEDLWIARWHLWRIELDARRNAEALRRAEKRWEEARRELPLEEVKILHESLGYWESRLGHARWEHRDVMGAQIRLQYAEKQLGVYEKAYAAARADADALLPGGTPGRRALKISGYEARHRQVDWGVKESQREIEATRGWVSELPEGIDRARKMARDDMAQREKMLEVFMEQRRCVAEALEKLESEEGEGGSAS